MKNRKGIFFTAIVIVILSLFVLSYTLYTEVYERKAVDKRISTMNSFLFSTEQDLSRKIYIFGYRVIFLDEKGVIDSGSYLDDFNSTVQEVFFNGTINNIPQDLMLGTTFADMQSSINQNAEKINVNIALLSPSIEVKQTDPWHVTFALTSNLQMQDASGLASWNKTATIEANVSIENFEDPMYYIETGGVVTNNITKTMFSVFVSGSDATNLSAQAVNSYYKASEAAPSFIDRLEGKNIPSQFGIESFVNLQKLSQQGITVKDKSVIDYIYFSDNDPRPLCTVAGTPAWFRIDSVNAPAYNVSC